LRENPRLAERHLENLWNDLDFSQLSEETKEELRMAGAQAEIDYDFEYEDDIAFEEDKESDDE
jgi:hypothetical protein